MLHVIISLGYHTQSKDVVRGLPAFSLGSTNGRMTSGVGCHHRVWKTYMVGRYRACYSIIAIRKHTRSEDVRRDMPSSPLERTNGWLTSGMACHHRLRTTYMVRLCQAWHAIMDLVQHIRLDEVGHGRPSLPFDSIYMFGKCRAWYAIITVGQHIRLENVRRGMPSWPLSTKHYRTISGVEGNHRP